VTKRESDFAFIKKIFEVFFIMTTKRKKSYSVCGDNRKRAGNGRTVAQKKADRKRRK